jgi:hypothetical protein
MISSEFVYLPPVTTAKDEGEYQGVSIATVVEFLVRAHETFKILFVHVIISILSRVSVLFLK